MSLIHRTRSGVAALLERPAVRRFDEASVDIAERSRGNAAVDRAAYALSEAANHSILWHAINAIDALIGGPDRRRAAVRRSIVLGAEQAIVNGPIKLVTRRARPDVDTNHPHTLRQPATSSFPSGHASAGACSATLMTKDLGHGWLWWSLATAVAWSRVHVGVHHGSDIVAGGIVGRFLGVVAGRVWPSAAERTGQEATRTSEA